MFLLTLCARACACMYVCVCGWVRARMCTCMGMCVRKWNFVYMYVCVSVRMRAHVWVHACVCVRDRDREREKDENRREKECCREERHIPHVNMLGDDLHVQPMKPRLASMRDRQKWQQPYHVTTHAGNDCQQTAAKPIPDLPTATGMGVVAGSSVIITPPSLVCPFA